MTDATPLTDAEIENLANQPRAYALTNAKVLATITSLQSDLQRTRDALEGAYALSIGWAAHWKHDHGNFAPEHLEILDQCAKALGLEIMPSKALNPPTGT
jgi:hypothetical protein